MADADALTATQLARATLTEVVNNPEAVVGFSDARLDLALRLARRARLLGRLAARLERVGALGELPPVARDQLRAALAMAVARERLARWEMNRIAYAARGLGDVQLIALKGCAYLLLELPNTAGRVFADVDLLTAESTLTLLEQELNAHGWRGQRLEPYDQRYYRRWTHELPPLTHIEREVEVDLHHNIIPRIARLKPSSAALIENSRAIEGSAFRVLADEDVVLHAMVHLMFDSDLADKLRDLVDINDMLGHFARQDDGFWDRLCRRAAELDLTRPAFYSLRYCRALLGMPLPQEVLDNIAAWAPPRTLLALMDRLVPDALYPQHPDAPRRVAAAGRLLLYMRSHWLRMPPWLLAYHLAYKFVRSRFARSH